MLYYLIVAAQFLVSATCVSVVNQRKYINSDTSDVYYTNSAYYPAQLASMSSGWPTISGAKWIWYTSNPSATGTYAFTKVFSIKGSVTSASIKILVDDTLDSILINNIGITFAISPSHTSFVTVDVTSSIITGSNTLKYTVTNNGLSGGICYQIIVDSQV